MSTRSAVVVGGGFAGLTSAYYLRRAGWQVRLIEASGLVGGRVATVRRQGYTMDTGATQISTGYTEYLALCAELGLSQEIVASSQAIGFIRHGRIHVIDARRPITAGFTPLLSWSAKLSTLKTLKDYRSLRPSIDVRDVSAHYAKDTMSAKTYAEKRLNREVYDALIDPLLRAYVMNRASNVSVLEWFSTLGNLAGRNMISINGGNDRLPLALANGLDLRLSTSAQSVRKIDRGVEIVIRTASGAQDVLTADTCVLATRLPEALAIYPPARELAGSLTQTLTYNRGLCIDVGYRLRPRNLAIGLLLGAVEHQQIGLIWAQHNKNPDRVPAGHSLFTVYFDEAINDQYFNAGDESLVDIASTYVERLFPELGGQRDLSHVTRWPLAIPNPAPGYYRQIHEMKARIDPADRLQLAGDYFTCVGQNSAIYYGKQSAERLIRHHGQSR
ncbi:MAG: Protoporphyrinogen oxidase [Hydrocarboniphaga sp.]|uniref:protoporphyrinogen/coproporphyrinogen oxidase n=1 Tax=Hydrocarboniphaga sp. TaxID=2033016 RepID=UPI002617FBCA|nr:FAD-dependent oxidoreductase [Hydrocarboniphaga sp.]MDB5971492.1 Protoporphyrinogen oxidase [Hydrocarboniphaga sp.]